MDREGIKSALGFCPDVQVEATPDTEMPPLANLDIDILSLNYFRVIEWFFYNPVCRWQSVENGYYYNTPAISITGRYFWAEP